MWALGRSVGLSQSYGNQALIHKAWGNLDQAMELHRKQEEICYRLGDQSGLAICFWNMGLLLKDEGKKEEAVEKFRASIERHEKLKHPVSEKHRKFLADYLEEEGDRPSKPTE